MNMPITCIVFGAGCRGECYSEYALDFPQQFKVIGVAEPRKFYRERIVKQHHIEKKYIFEDWTALKDLDRVADCVIIALPDKLHKEAAISMAEKQYHILLEKPMATSYADCLTINDACEQNKVILSICHVLRYTPQARRIYDFIKKGAIGDVVNIQLLEPIGFWHFAHSYVRGNWHKEADSSFSLLTKSCHDLDLIMYWMSAQELKCEQIQSFGSLKHFVAKNKPAGSSSRCMDCPVESSCVYSAKRIYLDMAKSGQLGFPLKIICEVPDIESVTEALQTGPYGRCVYDCDNDVVDNQVVNMSFSGGVTASFSMIAFSKDVCTRKVTIFGTKGQLNCDFQYNEVKFTNFLTEQTETHQCHLSEFAVSSRMKGHGSADFYNMAAFVDAISNNDPSHILTGPQASIDAHGLVFLAEKSRRLNCVMEVSAETLYQL